MHLTEIPSSECFPGGIPGMDKPQGPQAARISSFSYKPAFVKCVQQSLTLHLLPMVRGILPYTSRQRSRTEGPFISAKRCTKVRGQGQDTDPTQETTLSLFHLTNRQWRPRSSPWWQTQSFQPGYLPKQMVHTLASVIKKSQLSTTGHLTLSYTTFWCPSKKNSGQMYPEWINFFYWVVNDQSIKC